MFSFNYQGLIISMYFHGTYEMCFMILNFNDLWSHEDHGGTPFTGSVTFGQIELRCTKSSMSTMHNLNLWKYAAITCHFICLSVREYLMSLECCKPQCYFNYYGLIVDVICYYVQSHFLCIKMETETQ